MSRPLARAGVAAAFVCALSGLCALVLAANLPYWRPVWLVNPLIGIDIAPSEGGGSLAGLAGSIGLGATLLMAVAFYLDHCVIRQPNWALFLGWGMLLGGSITETAQVILQSSHTLFIDIDHGLWRLGEVEVGAGVLVVLISWLRAPDLFSPHLRRWMLIAWIASLAALVAFGTRLGISSAMSFFLFAVISLAVLIGGSLIVSRSESRPVPVQ